MQIFISPLNVISRLLLSKSAEPKVITINGFHCTWVFPVVACFFEKGRDM